MLGQREKAADVLAALSFAFDEEFEERWQIFFAADSKANSWIMQAGKKLY